MDIKNTIFVNQAFASAQRKAESYRHEFIMPEHLLSAIIEQEPFIHTLQDTFYNYVELSISLENYLMKKWTLSPTMWNTSWDFPSSSAHSCNMPIR